MATELGWSDRGNLSKLLQSLTLNSMHVSSVSISEEEISAGTTECHSSLVGRFMSTAIVTIQFLLPTMYKAWKTRNINVVIIWSHTYQLFFAKVEDRNRILSDGPWCFDDILLNVKAWDRKFLQVDDGLSMEEFCIHIRRGYLMSVLRLRWVKELPILLNPGQPSKFWNILIPMKNTSIYAVGFIWNRHFQGGFRLMLPSMESVLRYFNLSDYQIFVSDVVTLSIC